MTGVLFAVRQLAPEKVRGKRVLEVGSLNVDGSVRAAVEMWKPTAYVGVDIALGPGVDVVCAVEGLAGRFGPDSFDIVISTELVEHVLEWQRAVNALKEVVTPGGQLVVTTRSRGFPYHPSPGDYWRYEVEDMRAIFGDFEILSLEPDPLMSGVFISARKPAVRAPLDLSGYPLYSVVTKGLANPNSDSEKILRRARRLNRFVALHQGVLRVEGAIARRLLS